MGFFYSPSTIRTSEKPYRNWDRVAVGVIVATFAGVWLSKSLIDSSHVLQEPFSLHLKIALTNWPLYKSEVIPLFNLSALIKTWVLFIFLNVFFQFAAFAFFGRLIHTVFHVRGRRWLKGQEAIAEAKRASKHWLKNSKGEIEILKDIWLSSDRLLKSILLVGAQGGGKTQVLNLLLTQALSLGHKALIFDPTKGDYVKWVKYRVLVSSTDARTVHPYLGLDVQTVEDAQAFSEGLIEASDQPMWSNSARMICTGVIVHLQKKKPKDWSWPELSKILANQKLIQKACRDYPPAAPLVANLESKTTQSILMNLLAYGEMIYTLAQNFGKVEGKKFSFVNFILNDDSKVKRVVFAMNQRSPADAAFARALINLVTRRIGSLEFTESKRLRVGLWLDEIAQFGPLENLSKTMEVGRSKGIYVVAATQDFSQISKIYGQDELQKWDALFGLKVFMEIAGQESQDFVSKTVGKREVRIVQRNTSGNVSSGGNVNINIGLGAPQIRDVILPSEMATFGKRANGIESLWVGYSPTYAFSLTTPFVNPPDAFEPFVAWPQTPTIQVSQPEHITRDNVIPGEIAVPQKAPVFGDVKEEQTNITCVEDAPAQITPTNAIGVDDLGLGEAPNVEDMADGYIAELAGADPIKEELEILDMILPEPPPGLEEITWPAKQTSVLVEQSSKRRKKPRNYAVPEEG